MKFKSHAMNSAVLKLLEPAPALDVGGTIPIDQASQLGVERAALLRIAAAGRLVLYCRLGAERGDIVKIAKLNYDPSTGGTRNSTIGVLARERGRNTAVRRLGLVRFKGVGQRGVG